MSVLKKSLPAPVTPDAAVKLNEHMELTARTFILTGFALMIAGILTGNVRTGPALIHFILNETFLTLSVGFLLVGFGVIMLSDTKKFLLSWQAKRKAKADEYR